MLRKKIPNRKRKRIIKKYLFFAAGVIALVSLTFFTLHHFQPDQSFVSPLAKVGAFQLEDPKQQQVAHIKEILSQKQIDYQTISASGSSYLITLQDGGEVVLSSQKSLDSQISSLQFILSRLTMEGKPFTRLDLRFDKPVIKLRK